MPALVSNNAKATLASAVSAGATSLPLATGTGDLFPGSIHSPMEYFYVRVGEDADHEVVKCTDRSGDTLVCEATVNGWDGGSQVGLTVCAELIGEFPRVITSDTWLHVSATGPYSFPDFDSALAAIQNILIAGDAWLTIHVVGRHTISQPISSGKLLSPSRVRIAGNYNPSWHDKAIFGVSSSSGTAGNWSVVLIAYGNNVTIGDFLLIDTATGGTHPGTLIGAHRITSFDANSITVNVRNPGPAPSGAVTGTSRLITTVITCSNCGGLEFAENGFGMVQNVAFTTSSEGQVGLSVGSGRAGHGCMGYLDEASFVAFNGFAVGVQVNPTSTLDWQHIVFVANCGIGITVDAGNVCIDNAFVTGCPTGMVVSSGVMIAPALYMHGCATGALVEHHGALRLGNLLGNYARIGACTTGLQARTAGYIMAENAVFAGNTDDCDPDANTQGNEFGYIST